MTIEIRPEGYYVGMWYLAGRGQDFLAAGERQGTKWVLTYRFRYYAGPDPWDFKDEKNWYRVEVPCVHATEAEFIDKIDQMVGFMVALGYMHPKERPWRRLVRGGGEAMLAEFEKAPWAHVKKVVPE